MMKKIVALIVILLVCLFVLTGCTITISPSVPKDDNSSNKLADRFVKVKTEWRWDIYVDRETNVMYLYAGGSYEGGITAMFDADGKPLLYEGEYGEYD